MRSSAGRGRGWIVAAVLAVLAQLALPASAPTAAHAAGADMTRPDTSFGGGFPAADLSPNDDEAIAVAVQSDGAVVAVGHTALDPYSHDPQGDFLVTRFTPAGVLDRSFGLNGSVVLGGPATFDEARAVVVQGDGKILVGGDIGDAGVVVRLTSTGALDPAFQGGIVTIPGVGLIVPTLSLLPDGRIVVATGSALARLNPDGRLDGSFGVNGVVPRTGSDFVTVEAMAIQSDGRIVVAGNISSGSFGGPTEVGAVVRYSAAGALDPSFGNGGVVTTDFDTEYMDRGTHFDGLAIQPDGRIVVGGNVYIWGFPNLPPVPGSRPPVAHTGMSDVALVRYLPDGRLDPSFAGSGKVITRVPGQANPDYHFAASAIVPEAQSAARSVAIGPGGAILVAGISGQGLARPVALRYTSGGLLDTTFGRNGAMVLDLGNASGWANALALQPDGRLVLAGATLTGWREAPNFTNLLVGKVLPGSSAGSVWTWGWNGVGQLGDGTIVNENVPTRVPGLTGVVAVSAGTYHTLALRGDGTVWAWGWNVVGQLGDGTTIDRWRPVQVPGLSGVVGIAAGGLHSLAVRGDGTVWAWGYNGSGQLGDGTTVTRLTPVKVNGLVHATAVSAGLVHSMALREDGTLWTWGQNGYGELGDGSVQDRSAPVMVPLPYGGYAHVQAAAGALHSLALSALGELEAWGWDGFAQLGTPYPTGMQVSPRTGVPGVLGVSGGWYHSLQLYGDGHVEAMGWNGVGQLGTSAAAAVASVVPGVTGVSAISAGGLHSLALTRDRRVQAWGWNAVGQLGIGTTTDPGAPVTVVGLTNPTSVSAGALHSVAIQA